MGIPNQFARELRQRMTPEEKILWEELRDHRFKGWKFRRQHPIVLQEIDGQFLFYVADYYCARKKLIIELDGKFHEFLDQKIYDMERTKSLGELNFNILRIKNQELNDIKMVLQKIEEFVSGFEPLRH